MATLISWLAYSRNRPKLVQLRPTYEKMYETIVAGQLSIESTIDGAKVSETLPDGILVHLSFLNASPKDISFFSTGFYVKSSRKEIKLIECYTLRSFRDITSDSHIIFTSAEGLTGEVFFPPAPFGAFKAHSYTPFWFFMPIRDNDDVPKEVTLSLNYAVRHFPFFGRNSYSKNFKVKLNLSNFDKELLAKRKLMQKVTEQMLKSSKKTPSHTFYKDHKKNNPSL